MAKISSNKQLSVWKAVGVTKEDHPRFRQAGTVQAIPEDREDVVGVKFDIGDQEIETVLVSHLETL